MHTREIDLMGGLAKPLPKTALLFFVGAIAICGLPPLNGFVSELFIYLTFGVRRWMPKRATLAFDHGHNVYLAPTVPYLAGLETLVIRP